MSEKVCVIGLGYIGLPNAVVLAESGYDVIGVDVDQKVVEQLNKGEVRTDESGIAAMVKELVQKGKLKSNNSPVEADVFIIAVPTPHNEDLTADLYFVKQAISSILPVLKKEDTVIIESTIPPRTTRDIIAPIIESQGFSVGDNIYLAHCPERVVPGRILIELYENSRTIGGINDISARKAADVYRRFVKGKIIETTAESAEMSKLMENTYRGVNIALANELAKVSEKLKINTHEVISLANEHPRVNIHQPGPGVGGHCIAVDPYFIIEKDPFNTELITKSMEINESMPDYVIEQVKKAIQGDQKIALFGLAYKGNIDDVRDSPAVKIAEKLLKQNYNVDIYDPFVRSSQIPFELTTFKGALENADLLLILTDHDEFKNMDWKQIKTLMRTPIVIDTKHCVKNKPNDMEYYSYSNLYELRENNSVKIGKQQV